MMEDPDVSSYAVERAQISLAGIIGSVLDGTQWLLRKIECRERQLTERQNAQRWALGGILASEVGSVHSVDGDVGDEDDDG